MEKSVYGSTISIFIFRGTYLINLNKLNKFWSFSTCTLLNHGCTPK
ncbi:hypothetical protein MtrunA17_Chr7g0273461 [Medicago truncatula]|uniref:Uncharacterized protein n=1 Tax=Medicago truncatula TaxID=3880 RepID=A0A396H9X7_MEDTR|nr:hypothetical protein MtrunA17_Chr7g0273461 [Medicago truncatula]